MTIRVTRSDFTLVLQTTTTEGHGLLSEAGTLWVEEQMQKLADAFYEKEKALKHTRGTIVERMKAGYVSADECQREAHENRS